MMMRMIFFMITTVLAAAAGAQDVSPALQAKAAEAGLTVEQAKQKAAEFAITSPDGINSQAVPEGFGSWSQVPADKAGGELMESGDVSRPDAANADDSQNSESPVKNEMLPDGVRPFGYDIFNLSKTTFEPLMDVTVPDDYPVGPGDELIITVWGETQLYNVLTVQRNGSVVLPNVGLVTVNGQTLEELRKTLVNRMSRYYSSLGFGKPGARSFLDVSLGKLKSIRVYVLGEVKKPGGYVLSSMATVFTGLYHAGGPTLKGSLREIEVKRGDATISKIDLYDYLINGDNSRDIRLENGDIIMVKPVGRTVTLTGHVFRAARYELQAGETFADLLRFAGGFMHDAYLDRISLKRVIPFEERSGYENDILFIDFTVADNAAQELIDGDVITVHGIAGKYENYVAVSGAVGQPGEFGLTPGMTVSTLLNRADGVQGDAFMQKGEIIRTLPDLSREILPFNVSAALAGDPVHDLALMNLDEIRIYSVNEFRDKGYIAIDGAVRKPGIYELVDSMSIVDVILKAGGFKDKVAPTKAIEVYRLDVTDLYRYSREYAVEAVGSIFDINRMEPFYLQKYDRIFVRENPAFVLQKTVQVNGEVRYPGVYPIESNGVRISDIIAKAGGLKHDAFIDGFEFKREEKIVFINLHDILKRAGSGRKSEYDIFLREGDELFIPQNPHVVRVSGEVMTPSLVLFQEGKGVDYYIEQAGGFTDNADKKRMQVKLANGKMWKSRCLLPDQALTAGTNIIVPKKIEKDNQFWENSKDVVGILSSLTTMLYLIYNVSK